MSSFISTERKGFKMTFENGLTVSVQWGRENYCSNKIFELEDIVPVKYNYTSDMESETAEVAIMLDNVFIDPYVVLSNDYCKTTSILGYLNTDNVVDIMMKVKNFDTSKILIQK